MVIMAGRLTPVKHCAVFSQKIWARCGPSPSPEPLSSVHTRSSALNQHTSRWAADVGIQSNIRIAKFGALRGCAAGRDIEPGENLLSIPAAALIYEDTVRKTDVVSLGQGMGGSSSPSLAEGDGGAHPAPRRMRLRAGCRPSPAACLPPPPRQPPLPHPSPHGVSC